MSRLKNYIQSGKLCNICYFEDGEVGNWYKTEIDFGDQNIQNNCLVRFINNNNNYNIFNKTIDLIKDAIRHRKTINYSVLSNSLKDEKINFINNNQQDSLFYKAMANKKYSDIVDNMLFSENIDLYFINEKNEVDCPIYGKCSYNENKFNQFMNDITPFNQEILEINRKNVSFMNFQRDIREIKKYIEQIFKERGISFQDLYREEERLEEEEQERLRNMPGAEITNDDYHFQGFNQTDENNILDAPLFEEIFKEGLLVYNPSDYYLQLLERNNVLKEIKDMARDNIDKKYISLKMIELKAIEDKLEKDSQNYINYYNTMVNQIGVDSTQLLYENIKELLKNNKIEINDLKEIFKDLGIISPHKLNKLFENINSELFSELKNIKNEKLRSRLIRNAMEAGKKKLKSLKKKMLKKKSKKPIKKTKRSKKLK